MIGRYLAAAKGSRNVAASGGASMRGLKGAKSTSVSGGGARVAPPISSSKPTGSMAGYMGGRSTYIQPNGSGYGTMRPKPDTSIPSGRLPSVESFKPSFPNRNRTYKI